MDYQKLAERIFPEIKETIADLEKKYPERKLAENAFVTRLAPSPTGYMHIGGLYAAMISKHVAQQSQGVFFLRIEDTDRKREIEGGVEEIITSLVDFKISSDEGPTRNGSENGEYGPYKQRNREKVYQICAKELMRNGLAYPCFCSVEELAETRKIQEEAKETIGYHGEYAKCRQLSYEEIEERIHAGQKYVVRFKSNGDEANRIIYHDLSRGEISLPENILDFILLKSDQIPTYHFAHVIDDHFMRTTHVIRGDEWLASYPIHDQLFKALDFTLPQFVHIAPIMKSENGSKRKLSKRKDPEAAVSYYLEKGYPTEAVVEYLLSIANSNFEEWRMQNPTLAIDDFTINIEKLPISGALFDMDKLSNISKEVIASKTPEECYQDIHTWAATYQPELLAFIKQDSEKFEQTIELWKWNNGKARKDVKCWADLLEAYPYIYRPEQKIVQYEKLEKFTSQDIIEFLESYQQEYTQAENSQQWFAAVGALGEKFGYCANMKVYKKNPEEYKGSVADVCAMIRMAITGKKNAPDLFTILTIIGKDQVKIRIDDYMAALKG